MQVSAAAICAGVSGDGKENGGFGTAPERRTTLALVPSASWACQTPQTIGSRAHAFGQPCPAAALTSRGDDG